VKLSRTTSTWGEKVTVIDEDRVFEFCQENALSHRYYYSKNSVFGNVSKILTKVALNEYEDMWAVRVDSYDYNNHKEELYKYERRKEQEEAFYLATTWIKEVEKECQKKRIDHVI